MKTPWSNQKSLRASASSVGSAGWDSPDLPRISSPPTSWSRLRVGSRSSQSFPYNLCCTICHWKSKKSLLSGVNTSSALIFEDGFLMRPYSPIPQCLRPEYFLSKFLPQTMHIRGLSASWFDDSHSCDELLDISLANHLSHAWVHFVTELASFVADHKMSSRPIRAKYTHFKTICEQSPANSPTVSSSSCLNWWSSRQGFETL